MSTDVKPHLLKLTLHYLNLFYGLKSGYIVGIELQNKFKNFNLKMGIIFLKCNNFRNLNKISLNCKIQKFLVINLK